MKRTIMVLLSLMMALAAVPAPAEETEWKLPLDLTPGMPLVKENYLSNWHYKDPTIEMEAREAKEGGATYWVAEVTIKDPTQIRTMPAYSFTSGSSADGKRLSQRARAVLACDGDFWGRDVYWKGNYVLRQGVLYTHELTGHSDILLIDEDGDFHIIHKARRRRKCRCRRRRKARSCTRESRSTTPCASAPRSSRTGRRGRSSMTGT